MADNMIELIAKINTAESEKLIQSQLNGIASKLKLDIKCNIDTSDISTIQKQLSNIGNNISVPEIKAPIAVDINETKKVTNDMVRAFNDAFGMIGKMGDTTKKQFNAQTKQMLQELQDAWKQSFETGNDAPYLNILDKLKKRIEEFNKGDIQQLKDNIADIRRMFTDGSKVTLPTNIKSDLKAAVEDSKLLDKYLTAVYGSKKVVSNGYPADKLYKGSEDFGEAFLSAAKKILEYQEKINSTGWGLEELQDVEKVADNIEDKLREIVGLPKLSERGETVEFDIGDAFNNEVQADIKTVKDEIVATTAEMSKLGDEIKKTEVIAEGFEDITPPEIKMPDIGLGYSTKDVTENAKSVLNDFFAANTSDDGLSRSVTRVTKAVEDAGEELQRFYVQVERSDKATETLTYAINEQGDAYEYLGKTIREADNSTDFRRKDIGTQWEIQSNKLKQFAQNADKAGLAGTALREDIKSLYEALNRANPDFGGDTSAMNAFLDKFDIAKAKLQAFNTEARKDNASKNLANRIKTLTANMNAYAVANDRAVKSTKEMSSGRSFADEWARLSTQMARGAELTDREVKDLTADFRVFGKEAEMAGLKGDSAFGKFLNSFKTMSSYITANMVFNLVKRQIREMVNEVITIDTAMTELRKVTEATNAEFEKFAQNAGKTGKELGATISDVINATSTFSRAGYTCWTQKNSDVLQRCIKTSVTALTLIPHRRALLVY